MSHLTTSDGLSLHYTDDGDGVPILCLAGLTRSTRDFDYVTPHLSDARLIKLDYRGRGQSDWDDNWQNYVLPVECRDVIELLDHLELERVAVLGTSRGGLNAMGLAMAAKERLLGVALNDIGPVIEQRGLDHIMGYLGRGPSVKTLAQAAKSLQRMNDGFKDVSMVRWVEEANRHFRQTEKGLDITYDPRLRDAVEAVGAQAAPDLWPYFDALGGLPLACIRGENSNLLSQATVQEMQRRRPDMIAVTVSGRGHVPFLDEPESVAALQTWLSKLQQGG
ncbi:alpha/beta hydrolase [uncultured Roseobacter sp.]|uniref:alpha/beta fold hydrolase n=1 Tax=uncultured Roseobacter sp. TaxID=114847 RepID=UPI002621644C|nr:alpha/beta hydrolase [uncultured Roseobacter sp.]